MTAVKHIASRTNPFYKQLRKLVRPGSGGGQEGLVWLEGVHLCQEYLQRVGTPRHAVFDAARAGGGELAALVQAVPPERCVALEGGLLEQVSEVAAAQGVGFLIDLPVPVLPERIAQSCVILDRLQDPGNVGSIVRSCAAAGVGMLLLTVGSARAWSGKVLRAAQGAHFAVAIYEDLDIAVLRQRVAVPVIVTALQHASDLYRTELPAPAAWVFGHEGQGVSADVLAWASHRVAIPQAPGVESLNVAAAAAVCLFEQRRRLLAAADTA